MRNSQNRKAIPTNPDHPGWSLDKTLEVYMRETIVAFIGLAGVIVIFLWILTITLAIRSGKDILTLISRRPKHEWLSIPDTIAQYGGDQSLHIG
jgi:uncharacterized protein involved in cysteine biosynthesis